LFADRRAISVALLECTGVTKYFGGLAALHQVDFRVSAGEIVGLIGPNGSGKTTLFNVITGLYPLSKGSIRFKEEEIGGIRPFRVCQKGIGRTFQTSKPFTRMTVLENVMVGALYGKGAAREDLKRARASSEAILEQAGLSAPKRTLESPT
jgi:branched-chain amino acid transport system ATP-binding protein